MHHRFLAKSFYHHATRHAGEGYAPVIAADGSTLAFLQVAHAHERLMLQRGQNTPAIALTDPGFLFSPVFAGDWLCWVEQRGTQWEIRTACWRDEAPTPRTIHAPAHARPLHLVSATGSNGSWLAWEERTGRRTVVQAALMGRDGGFTRAPQIVSPAETNGYDPALAVATDGAAWCACSAYADDNYRVFVSSLAADGSSAKAPQRVSHHHHACVWPSLAPSRHGGVWFSYTCYTGPHDGHEDTSHVRHPRYLSQRRFFQYHGRVYVGRLTGEQQEVAVGAPSPKAKPWHLNTGLVFGGEGAGHSQVIEDAEGGLHLLFRQHAVPANLLTCEHPAPELKRHPRFKPARHDRMHPNLAVTSLREGAWTPPEVIVPRAHFDLGLSFNFDGRSCSLAFAEDARRTGWSGEGEWFDDIGEVGLGVLRLAITPTAAPALAPLATPAFPSGRLTNPHTIATELAQWRDRTLALGQTHCHSNLSVCHRELDRDPHFNYRFMQDVQHCRFGALTDHEYNLWHTEMLLLRKLAEYYYFPGEFVALPAYEWTGSDPRDCGHDGGPFGHFNVLGFEPLAPGDFYNPNDPADPGNTPAKFWQRMGGRKLVTPPHHVVDFNHFYHWEFWDDAFQPVVEIFQDDRGSGEQAGAPGVTNGTKQTNPVWALDALRSGKRFGFIAAGDHAGIALAGVWTRELTREALHAAMHERLCYATTGAHVAVILTANDQPMGAAQTGPRTHFELRIGSTETPARIEVLRNGSVVRQLENPTPTGVWRWQEPAAQTGDFWYARIHWPDGELAWTSPVWL